MHLKIMLTIVFSSVMISLAVVGGSMLMIF